MKFRFNTDNKWFKGNTHLHSIASDGGKDFSEIAQMYASVGYDFLFRTDHWVLSDVQSDNCSYPLLWLDGTEIGGYDQRGSYFHVVCLGTLNNIYPQLGLKKSMQLARQQNALLILAHPFWSGNSLDDALYYEFDGIEIYNHVCHWLNGKSSGLIHWNAALRKKPELLAFACDDAHLLPEHPTWNGGWIMVNAPQCSREAIVKAIKQGNYYSSCGPELKAIFCDGDYLHLESSAIAYARLVGPDIQGLRKDFPQGKTFNTACFPIPKQWKYAYLELEDSEGRKAWTNNLFLE